MTEQFSIAQQFYVNQIKLNVCEEGKLMAPRANIKKSIVPSNTFPSAYLSIRSTIEYKHLNS